MTRLAAKLKEIPFAAAANARWKAWLVEREAASIRSRYSLGARSAALHWPRPAGGLHIFLMYSLCNWEAVLPTALSQFGEVTQFEFRSAGFDESARDWLASRGAMNDALLEAFFSANRRRRVDVVVAYCSGYTVDPSVLREMTDAGAIVTNFCFDDKIRWPGAIRGGRYASTAAIADAVDLNLTSDPQGAARYFAHGGLSMFHAEAADETWYRPLDIPFEYDVSFVGACFGWRPKLIDGLRRRGIDVVCFGRGWPNGAVANEDMNGIYARSRINLGCGGIGYSKDLLCLKGRDFEVPMAGALYLTQDNRELSQVFEIGREILTYRDVEDCARTIHAVLRDTAGAARIRADARARSLRDHTYRARWSQVFRTIGALGE